MKLRLPENQRPPVPLRLTLPGEVAFRLDSYRAFVRESTGRDMETKELAVKMLGQFLESDKAFRRFLGSRSEPGSDLESGKGAGHGSGTMQDGFSHKAR
jgi:hypothetical protein